MKSLGKISNSVFALSILLMFATGALCVVLLSGGSPGWFNSAPVTAKQGKKAKKPGNDQPDKAVEFRRLQMQDENGFIPPDGIQKARQHIARMKQARPERLKAKQAKALKSPSPAVAGIEPGSWTWLGPGNIGGRIRSIVIHPTNPNNMWVGSVSGGIWRTTNGGASWQPVDDFMANLAVSTMVINPANTNTMYAGTGEGFIVSLETINALQTAQGAGVFRSTDGGVTWNQLAETNGLNWVYVFRLAISPNGNTILAGTNSGLWRSTNGGDNWNMVLPGIWYDIDFHPTNSNHVIVGGEGRSQFSTDGGRCWGGQVWNGSACTGILQDATFNPAITGRVELAYAPSNPTIVYASVNRDNGAIFRSADGGLNYNNVNVGDNFLGDQGWYDNIIWINPQDANDVIVGGIHLWRGTYNSTTQVLPLAEISSGAVHSDQHFIVAQPGFNNGNSANRKVFFGNDGGVYRANDIATVTQTTGWTALNTTLGITQFYGAAGSPRSGAIIGGTQDNGSLRYTGGNSESWVTWGGGDGGFCAVDPINSNYFYGEYIQLAIYRSADGGATSPYIYCDPAQIHPTTNVCQSATGISDAFSDANFVAPFILDPNNANTMLAGGRRLWRSTNVKATIPTWTAIRTANPGNRVSAIAVASGNSDVICVGHNNGEIWLTTNGTNATPTWTQIDTANLPNRFVTRVVIDHTRNPQWIYAVFGGFAGDNIYRTTDLGATWTDVTGTGATGLPDVPVRTLVFHPDNPNLLYAGTEIGIFTSDDAGATWDLPQDGPANVSVDELFWMNRDLVAATHGRSMYRASGGTYVNCNWTGIQDGSYDRPFRTVTAAINAAVGYKTIWIRGCNYNETFTTNKRLDLRRWDTGVATIGAP